MNTLEIKNSPVPFSNLEPADRVAAVWDQVLNKAAQDE